MTYKIKITTIDSCDIMATDKNGDVLTFESKDDAEEWIYRNDRKIALQLMQGLTAPRRGKPTGDRDDETHGRLGDRGHL